MLHAIDAKCLRLQPELLVGRVVMFVLDLKEETLLLTPDISLTLL